MRPPPQALIGVAFLVLAMSLVSLGNVVSSLAIASTHPQQMLDILMTATRLPALVVVTAGLLLNTRRAFLVAWIAAAITVSGTVTSFMISIFTTITTPGTLPTFGLVIWLIGFGAAGALAFALWLRSPTNPTDEHPWLAPAVAYETAVHQSAPPCPNAGSTPDPAARPPIHPSI